MNPPISTEEYKTTNYKILALVTICIGIGSGFIGMMLDLLLHWISHWAYDYSTHQLISQERFLEGVSAASPERRVSALLLCGFIAGFGWWALYRYGATLVSISTALKSDKKMPRLATIIHAFLQMITIALGSPLGREVAPRELGSVFAVWISSKAGLSAKDSKVMLACGAGAALAAVYNVPLGGAVFILEVLLCTCTWPVLIPASAACAIATLVSWWGLGNETIYHVPHLTLNASVIVWSIVSSPILGFTAYWFIRVANKQRQKALHDGRMILACLVNFTLIGLLAIYFPILLGNGESPIELELSAPLGIALSALFFILRSLIIWSSLRSGAQGGLLTPSLANGALLAAVLGELWSYLWPSTCSIEGFVTIGAAAFLAAAQKMPLTAVVLIFEFTHLQFDFLVPVMLAVSGSAAVCRLCEYYFFRVI